MKRFKRLLFSILILLLMAVAFRGWLYRTMVTYQSIGNRPSYTLTNQQLISYTQTRISKEQTYTAREVVQMALDITSAQLQYSTTQRAKDPNQLVKTNKAHCVGYAAFTAMICNYLFNHFQLAGEWVAKPQIGQLHFLGINVHPYFNSPFFKDHDFVIIENPKTGERIAVDPTVADYLDIAYVSLQ